MQTVPVIKAVASIGSILVAILVLTAALFILALQRVIPAVRPDHPKVALVLSWLWKILLVLVITLALGTILFDVLVYFFDFRFT